MNSTIQICRTGGSRVCLGRATTVQQPISRRMLAESTMRCIIEDLSQFRFWQRTRRGRAKLSASRLLMIDVERPETA